MDSLAAWAKRAVREAYRRLEALDHSNSPLLRWLPSGSWNDPLWLAVFSVSLWLAVFAVLALVASVCWQLVLIALAILAGFVTEGILKGIQNYKPRKMIQDVEDKAVFITGCDSGFGLALAGHLVDVGFTVYAGCMEPGGAGPTSLSLRGGAGRVRALRCDVTRDDEVAAAQRTVARELAADGRRLWAVVNNAGVATCTEIEWCSIAEFRRNLDVNALGAVRVTKAFLPLMRGRGGRVVIVASLAGRYTFPGFTAYSMSKHAAVSFADGLRLEMTKWGISVHCVEPTLYRTPISDTAVMQGRLDAHWDACPPEVRDSYGRQYFSDFKKHLIDHLETAKPRECVGEVVEDMADAVCGTEPKPRYVPSVKTQLRCRLLSSLPVEVRQQLLLKGAPKTPPAFATRNSTSEGAPRKQRIQRFNSMPAFDLAPPSPSAPFPPPNPRAHPGSPKFIFDKDVIEESM